LGTRVYLTGRLAVEHDGYLLDGGQLGGRQGRLLFACLAWHRDRPLTRDELAELLWGEEPPPSWDTALSAVVSNLRRVLERLDLGRRAVEGAFGCYQLALPDAWVDVEAARLAADEAQGYLRAGRPAAAYGCAGVATAVARRPFLAGEEGPWVEARRAELRAVLLGGLDCFAEIFVWNGEVRLAVEAAAEAVRLEPFRETGYQRLMRAHAAAGNRAEALRTYARCRELLAHELGVDPSPETQAVYVELLRT